MPVARPTSMTPGPRHRPDRSRLTRAAPLIRATRWLCVVLVAGMLAACGEEGSTQPDAVSWRGMTIDVPDGWWLFEEGETLLSIANHDLGPSEDREPGERPDGDVVGMFFTYEPDTLPDDWRTFVEEQDATLESDTRLTLDEEIPATQLVYSLTTNGTPTREMVVVIPSRGIVVLAQPVPREGDTDAPEVFLRHIETFQEVLRTAEFGAPVTDDDAG